MSEQLKPRRWAEHNGPVFLTKDHPEANGRKAVFGEREYTAIFPLEDGTTLTIKMGQEGFDHTTQLLMDMLTGAESYDENSNTP